MPDFDDLATRLRIVLGLCPDISTYSLKDQVPGYTCLYFKFKCDNGPGVVDTLQETVEGLKEFICQMNESLQPLVEAIEIEVVALEDGAAILVNLDTHPILGPYVEMAKMSAQPVETFQPKVELKIGADVNLSSDELVASSGYLGIHAKSKSIVQMLLNEDSTFLSEEMDVKLKQAIKKKLGIEVSMFLSLVNLKSLNLSLEMYEINGDLIQTKMNLKQLVAGALEKNAENPMLALLRSLEFLKTAIDGLNENNTTEMSIGVSADKLNARIDLSANLSEIFEMIFADDE